MSLQSKMWVSITEAPASANKLKTRWRDTERRAEIVTDKGGKFLQAKMLPPSFLKPFSEMRLLYLPLTDKVPALDRSSEKYAGGLPRTL